MILIDLRVIKGQKMRSSIIQAAINILEQEGMEGISAKKIADTLKISKSNIFHHFQSVDNIIEEVFETVMGFMTDSIAVHSYQSAKDFILHLGQGISNLSSEERTIYIVTFQFYTLGLHDKKYQDQLLKQKQRTIDLISKELYKCTGAKKEICKSVSEMILMTLDGYGLSALMDNTHDSYQKLWEISTHYWCDMLSEEKGELYD